MIKKGKSTIFYLSLIGFFAIFSTTISKNPVLPLFAKSLGATESLIGLIAALSPLAGIIFGLPVGIAADKIGRKKLLFLSGLIFVIAPLLYIFVTNPFYLLPIRFFHGLATAILGPIASTIISERYRRDRGEKLGVYSSATLVGRTLAPLLGGFLISAFLFLHDFWNYRIVYLSAFLFSIAAFVLILFLGIESGPVKKASSSFGGFFLAARSVLKQKVVIATAVTEMTTYFAFGAFETHLPLYLDLQKFSAALIGIIFSLQAASIALSKPFFGRIADRIDKRLQIMAGLIFVGLSIAAIPFFSAPKPLIAISLLFGLGMSFTTVATSAFTADAAKKKQLGASMGVLSSIMDIGHTLGPFIVGLIISLASFKVGFGSCLALILVSIVVFAVTAYNTKKVKLI